jgi:hypothetical protein
MTRPQVSVEALGDDRYRVRIQGATEHEVTATPAILARVTQPGEEPEQTVARAFAFLLDREPPRAILRRFSLEDIATYFPEFWGAMTS